MGGVVTAIKISSMFILLYDHVGLVSSFIDMEQASMEHKGIKKQQMSPVDANKLHSALNSKLTMGLQRNVDATDQIQTSSLSVEVIWTKVVLVKCMTMDSTRQGNAYEINCSTREVVGSESELIFVVLCTDLAVYRISGNGAAIHPA